MEVRLEWGGRGKGRVVNVDHKDHGDVAVDGNDDIVQVGKGGIRCRWNS